MFIYYQVPGAGYQENFYTVTIVRLTFHERSEVKRRSRRIPETSGWLHG